MTPQEKIIEKARAYIKLSSAEELLIIKSFQRLDLKKGEFLLEMDRENDKVSYLESGLLRSYYDDEEGKEITSGFFQEDSFCTDLMSFQSGGKSKRSIEALLDCELYFLSKSNLTLIRRQVSEWLLFEQHYIANLLLGKVNFQRELANSNTQEAYERFNEQYNQAARFAPRYQIASFLGISPFTLSRISNR
ncbi:MAG: Crp/Fnr family transcriptional regulator [Bacteroidota bacterium]